MSPFTENHSIYFNPSRFGKTATILGNQVNGLFDNGYVEDDNVDIAGTMPVFRCKQADVSAATIGTVITIDGQTYKIREKAPDGTGHTKLYLEESP